MRYEQEVLERFLRKPSPDTDSVLDEFAALEGAVCHRGFFPEQYVYVPGKRKDRVLLVAHADTYQSDPIEYEKQDVVFENGFYKSTSREYSLGADDRAGCALLYLLKDSGHSLLVLDGEEEGLLAARYLRDECIDFFNELQRTHSYIVEFDLGGGRDVKYYTLPVSDEFRSHIASGTGFSEVDSKRGGTDILALCFDICGVNVSVGFEGTAHSVYERLCYKHWRHTYRVFSKFLAEPQRRFPLKETFYLSFMPYHIEIEPQEDLYGERS